MADDGHGGKVPGKWKDQLPIVPDKVAEHLDAGHDVPLEAVVSDKAMEKFEDDLRKRAEPVHAEDLVPVRRDDPRIQMDFGNGTSLPKAPVRRRVIPAPFRRPAIHIDHHGKSWQVKKAADVAAGDIVPDVGRVVQVQQVTLYRPRSEILGEALEGEYDGAVAVGVEVKLTGIDGCVRVFGSHEQVRVFTARPQEAESANAG